MIERDTVNSFNWPKRIALPAGLAIMETCWLFPWALLVGQWVQFGGGPALLSPTGIYMLIVASHTLRVMVLRRKLRPLRAGSVLGACGLVAVLLALYLQHYDETSLIDPAWLVALATAILNAMARPSAPALATALGLYLWWRGIWLARSRISFDSVANAFKVGLVAMVAFLLLARAETSAYNGNLETDVGVYVVVYFFASLISLSLTRVAIVRERSLVVEGRALPLNRGWLVMVLGVVCGLLVVTLGIARPLSFDIISAISRPGLELLAASARAALDAIALALDFLIALLRLVGRFLFGLGVPAAPLETPDPSTYLDKLLEKDTPPAHLRDLARLILGASLALVGIVVAIMLTRSMFKWIEREGDDQVAEDRDSVLNWSTMLADVLAWLQSFLRFFLRKRRSARAGRQTTLVDVANRSGSLLGMREIYRELLRLGGLFGLSRPRHATPYEYLPRLQQCLKPDDDLATITDIYVKARYGQTMPTEAEVDDARARLKRVGDRVAIADD
ncbi:MAG: DUF4129 domain-containing protein [Chloroflexi bacterium]|nr:DUF4129 domain-containing protein [Chloroflexota bacterium]